jgi:hypothetical protein
MMPDWPFDIEETEVNTSPGEPGDDDETSDLNEGDEDEE